jgi:hypothetical protein
LPPPSASRRAVCGPPDSGFAADSCRALAGWLVSVFVAGFCAGLCTGFCTGFATCSASAPANSLANSIPKKPCRTLAGSGSASSSRTGTGREGMMPDTAATGAGTPPARGRDVSTNSAWGSSTRL